MKKILFFIVMLGICSYAHASSSKKVAFLSSYSDLAALQANGDDDEAAAANWLVNTYGGTFLPTANVTSIDVLDDYDAIWVAIDRVGLQQGSANLPAEYTALFDILEDYSKNGGNLLLTNHATSIVAGIGRTTRQPGIFGSGAGADNGDKWGMNVTIGLINDPVYADYRNHEFFVGITFENANTGFVGPDPNDPSLVIDWQVLPFITTGYKEDHNCMWDLNQFGYTVPEGSNTVAMYEAEADCEILGTWQHVRDFCCAGMVDFHAQENGYGRIVCVGVAAYEWHQNVESNSYQSNIEKMTENILNELTKTDDGGAATLVPAVESPAFSVLVDDNTVRVESNAAYANFTLFAIDGRMMGKYSSDEMKNGVELPGNGCYIMQAVTLSGKTETTKFIK